MTSSLLCQGCFLGAESLDHAIRAEDAAADSNSRRSIGGRSWAHGASACARPGIALGSRRRPPCGAPRARSPRLAAPWAKLGRALGAYAAGCTEGPRREASHHRTASVKRRARPHAAACTVGPGGCPLSSTTRDRARAPYLDLGGPCKRRENSPANSALRRGGPTPRSRPWPCALFRAPARGPFHRSPAPGRRDRRRG